MSDDSVSETIEDLLSVSSTDEMLHQDNLFFDGTDSGSEILSEPEILSNAVLKCTCGSGSRAHKRTCPMNSRQCYSGAHQAETKAQMSVNKPSSKTNSDLLKPPPPKKCKTAKKFDIGDYVAIHSSTSKNKHVLCCIAEIVNKHYRLSCKQGVLDTCYTRSELTPLTSKCHIPLDGWRLASRVSFRNVISNPVNVECCDCLRPVSAEAPIDLTENCDEACNSNVLWVDNSLYKLSAHEKDDITRTEWLNDNVIAAAQLLLLQHFPRMLGLQHPVLQQTLSFHVHQHEFIQIVNVAGIHWCAVSNVGCEDGVVNVYDSSFSSVSNTTAHVLASLVFSITDIIR